MLAATATTEEATDAPATNVGRCEGLFQLGLGVGGLGVLLGCVHHALSDPCGNQHHHRHKGTSESGGKLLLRWIITTRFA
jgi:hypothetical protein